MAQMPSIKSSIQLKRMAWRRVSMKTRRWAKGRKKEEERLPEFEKDEGGQTRVSAPSGSRRRRIRVNHEKEGRERKTTSSQESRPGSRPVHVPRP
ncbi:uncharacterized protein BJX67DRAFT_231248 [Aspergillus lucknowensis]|uniref:Uncharacterized protein n=1 Tax=Aspergillus lucknowensis TaxID=176173 RepID=A0ABR4LH83_9EURO